jgi:hypothetical protein
MHRYRLSIGYQRALAGRVVLVLLGAGFMVVAAALGGWVLGKLAVQVLASDPDSEGILFLLPIAMSSSLGALTTYGLTRSIGRLFQAAWLEGTWLIVRDWRVSVIDLAASRWLSVQQTSERLAAPEPVGVLGPPPTVPVLVVNSSGPEVRLRLASRERALLPPEQLFLLANALSVARCPGAAETVTWLRAMAARTR